MKKITNNSAQTNAPKRVIKINILYIIAFQLLGFATTLFLEYQPLENNNIEMNLAHEDITAATNDLISYQICDQETCTSMLP